MNILEILYSKTEELSPWQQNGAFELTSFVVDSVNYVIQIQKNNKLDAIPELDNKKIGEVSFFVKGMESEDAHSTQDASRNSIKIYGTVFAGVRNKFAEYDAFFFSPLKRHSKSEKEFDLKTKIYRDIAENLKRTVAQCKLYEKRELIEYRAIASKIYINEEHYKEVGLTNYQREAYIGAFGCQDAFSESV